MNHVVTGATGFVGSSLVLELLLKTNQMIIGVVRPRNNQSATQRLHNTLIPLVHSHELPARLVDDIQTRVVGITGDLEQQRCGVDEQKPALMEAEFWHCAASLQYQDRHREQIDRTNVGGTVNALDLANSLKSNRFNMISTAYVAGSRRGLVEAEVANIALANNMYERSKILAEQKVRDQGIHYRILRPSIVVGHSKTHNTTSADGIYGILRTLRKFKAMLDHTQAGLADRLEIRMLGEPDGTVDLVPVDYVARDAVSLSLADAPIGQYHLTNPTSPTVGESMNLAFTLTGLKHPNFVSSIKEFSALDAKLHQRVDFYKSYIVNSKSFGRSSVYDVLGSDAHTGYHLGVNELTGLANRYIEKLPTNKKKAGVA